MEFEFTLHYTGDNIEGVEDLFKALADAIEGLEVVGFLVQEADDGKAEEPG